MVEYTDEELQKLIQAEADRRVNQALENKQKKYDEELKKALENERELVKQQIADEAKLSAEEKAKKELEKREKELLEREKILAKENNNLYAKNTLTEAGVPKEAFEKLLGIIVNDSDDMTKTNVANFIEVFNDTKNSIEKSTAEKYSKVPAPKSGESKTVDKTTFDKMSYAEKLKLKTEQPELFKQFMK